MTWSSEWTHERGQGCAAESQSRATIENGESSTSSGIALESPIGRKSQSHLVVVALSRHEIAWLRPEKVQEGETLKRVCGEARRKRNESCSRNRGPESRRSYHRHLSHRQDTADTVLGQQVGLPRLPDSGQHPPFSPPQAI